MPQKRFLTVRTATMRLLFFGLLMGGAWAQTETVLYSFCKDADCPDGKIPVAGVVFDKTGNLHGTTIAGGTYGQGAVFEITPTDQESVLLSFCQGTCYSSGSGPEAGLVFDRKGNLYGTTLNGGANLAGAVFKLTPDGQETILYSFCKLNNCADGSSPYAGLVLDKEGNLYGTTTYGGANSVSGCPGGCGVVFKITPNHTETVLHAFCSHNSCNDGALPYAGLVFDRKGNLYGTTNAGGAKDVGVVFKLTPKGKETVLHSFCAQTHCSDGQLPGYAGVVLDQKGNLYGTTGNGGAYGGGTVLKLTPKGKETVLYSFCAQNNCMDGGGPYAGVVRDQKGNLYGTTNVGGAYAEGTVFKVTPAGHETALYSFCPNYSCPDGQNPLAGVILDASGNLYGTTPSGGSYGYGVAFKITP